MFDFNCEKQPRKYDGGITVDHGTKRVWYMMCSVLTCCFIPLG